MSLHDALPISSQTSTNTGTAFLNLVKPQDRSRSQQEIAIALGEKLSRMPGASVYVSEPQTLQSGGTGLPVQFVVQSPDIEYLREIIDPFLEEVRAKIGRASCREREEISEGDVDIRREKLSGGST